MNQKRVGPTTPTSLLLFLLPALAAVHIVLDWGSVGLWWGDTGRWLHEVDRYARGETLYRDFYWPFPPLAMWLFGGVGRILGSGTTVMFSLCAAVYLLLALQLARFVSRVGPGGEFPSVLVACTTLAIAVPYSTIGGSPLATGSYTPAAPLGFLFVLSALILALAPRPSAKSVLCACALAGCAVLTKHDFIPPAGVVALVAVSAAWPKFGDRGMEIRRTAGSPWRTTVLGLLVFTGVVAAGSLAVVWTAGADALPRVLTGAGHVGETHGRMYPSGQRLTLQALAIGVLGGALCLSLVASRAIRWAQASRWLIGSACVAGGAAAVHVWMSFRLAGTPGAESYSLIAQTLDQMGAENGFRLLRASLRVLHDATFRQAWPLVLPAIVLLAVWKGRSRLPPETSRLLLSLLLVALAARARRSFESAEWFHLFLEIPTYSLVVYSFSRARARQTLVVLCLLGLAFAGYWQWNVGRGPLSRAGGGSWVETARGPIRLSGQQPAQFEMLSDALSGVDTNRALLAFGYTGGYSYFLGYPNPTPNSQGFVLSFHDPEVVMERLLELDPAPLLLDSDAFRVVTRPLPRFDPTAWELPTQPAHYERIERPYFTRLLEACSPRDTLLDRQGGRSLYDCAPLGR